MPLEFGAKLRAFYRHGPGFESLFQLLLNRIHTVFSVYKSSVDEEEECLCYSN